MNKKKSGNKEVKKIFKWQFIFKNKEEQESMTNSAKELNMTLAGFIRHIYTNYKKSLTSNK